MSLDFLKDNAEFQDLLRACGEPGGGRFSISGVGEAARPYFLAMLAARSAKRIVFVQPADRSLTNLEESCQFFLSRLGVNRSAKSLPPLGENPYLAAPVPLEASASRMRFFYEWLYSPPALVLTNLYGLLRPFPAPAALPDLFLRLDRGSDFDRDRLLQILPAFGYAKDDLIAFRGEYAFRGGIVDVFSPWSEVPFRLEFGASGILSIREFDPAGQRTLRKIESCLIPSLTGPGPEAAATPFTEYLGDALFIVDAPEEIEREYEEVLDELREQAASAAVRGAAVRPPEEIYPPDAWRRLKASAVWSGALVAEPERRDFHFGFQPAPRFDNKILFFLQYVRRLQEEGTIGLIFLSTAALRQKMLSFLAEGGIPARPVDSPLARPQQGEILLALGEIGRGFAFPREQIAVFAEPDILTEAKVIVQRPSVRPSITQFQDLKRGDHVVHADYGVGLFQGLSKVDVEGRPREFMELRYRDGDALFVPVESLDLIQKFTPVGAGQPLLDKLGTTGWEKTKARTKKAVEKLARELLELYARRKTVRGFGFSPNGPWQEEFDQAFEYEETEDQVRSIKDIFADMESPAPMDRLLCGDVGYGKTEVALRAAFKAVMDGKQVAILCPTTVLASQHQKTCAARFALFPLRTAALTRLQSKAEQAQVVADLKSGEVDVVIGTHRLLSKDVEFRDLGLLVVDEEQRFGVSHKEKIKQLKANVDVLTLTATPIPRTLNMSLTGLRDISLIETAPRDRLAVHTVVTTFSPRLIAAAVRQELARGGQVYYILNKIEEMEHLAARIVEWVPSARVVTVHGQMAPAELERRMLDFIGGRHDVLVSTTIIENGIDIPLVNTLIVHRADQFGLAQLYQLRGRVGRSSRQAFAYFLVPPSTDMTGLARKRLEALKEFSELGSGFRLAMKDLEIRGAGHLFGEQQHGVMAAVGYDYFVHLLEGAIKELKGEAPAESPSEIHLRVDNRIPETYLPQTNLRLNLYKRISSADGLEALDAIAAEIEDRFGPRPPGVDRLLDYGRIKYLAQKLKIKSVERAEGRLLLRFRPDTDVPLPRMTRLLNARRGAMTPDGLLSLPQRTQGDAELLHETIAVLKELYGV